MTAPALSWGVLGTGWIADKFISAARANTSQRFAAVGSRSLDNAHEFARQRGIPTAHGSYEALVTDPAIDIIYVATPHSFHREHGMLAIEAGKHVLIEKPIALCSGELEQLLAAADRYGVMCQEAFWSFFLPKWDVIRQLLDDGVLGDVVTLIADHGEWLPPDHRIHRTDLAGGSLHDLGVYDFALTAWTIGRPTQVEATGTLTDTGVIGDVAVAARTDSGAVASLSTTMMTTTPCRAVIAGSEATLETDSGFFFPGGFTVTEHRTGRVLRWDEPNPRHGALYFEAAEVARRIQVGELETPVWTRQNSRDTTFILDDVKTRLGIA